MATRVTIDDVAALAKVSIKTVSRVLNDEPNVRPATRQAVRDAIERLDFRPSRIARSLASKRTFIIGLFYDNPCSHYVSNIQAGALKACDRHGYDLSVHPKPYQGAATADGIVELHRQARFDGVILTPPLADIPALIAVLRASKVPGVLVSPVDRSFGFPTVGTNDRIAAEEMTKKLIGLGHTKIAFVTGHPDHKAVGLRREGYINAMRSAQLDVPNEYVVQGMNSFDSGETAGVSLLQLRVPPTAIFCANDEMAVGVLKIANTLGIRVPKDLSIAGFDNIPLATQVWPPLTTIKQPVAEMGERAAEILIRRIEDRGPPSDIEHVTIKSEVVLRQSTAARQKIHERP